MTPCAFDNTMLTYLLNRKAKAPKDPQTGKPVDLAHERVKDLVKRLAKARQKIIIPTPVTAEILTEVGPGNADYLRIVNRARIFEVYSFDEVCAIELAFLNRDIFAQQDKRGKLETRQKVKVDRQILSICKVAGCDTLYADDSNLQNRAVMCGMRAIGIASIQIPDAGKQGDSFLEPHEPLPEVEGNEREGAN